jgi:hypothetical protein
MANRSDSIFFTIAGLLLALFSLYEILHHQYDFFLSREGNWTSYFGCLLLGLFFSVTGLIGWVRSMRGKRPIQPPDQLSDQPPENP